MNEPDAIGEALLRLLGGLGGMLYLLIIVFVGWLVVMWTIFPIVTYYQLKSISESAELTAIRLKNINERVARLETRDSK